MKAEKLLKDIKGLLNKHADFLNSNPEIFFAIEDRLFKAIDPDEDDYEQEGDENWKDPEDPYADDDYESDLLDKPEDDDYSDDEDAEYAQAGAGEDEESEADAWLRENDPARAAEKEAPVKEDDGTKAVVGEDELPPEDLDDEAYAAKPAADKKSSRMADWKPRDSYEAHHDAAIKQHIADGYSPREAERLAGAHQAPTDFYGALRHSTRPSEPSPKMLAQMKDLAHGWLRNADRKTAESAEADINPQKYASGKTLAAHDAAHKDFGAAYQGFLDSDEVKNLSGRARHQAVQAWKQKWQTENPDHKEAAINAASSGKALSEANDARKKRLQEGQASLLTAGFSSGEDNPMEGEFSSGAAGEQTGNAAAQSVGAEKEDGDGGFQTNIKKDPNLVFAEQNPDYIKHLKSKLATKMAPEQAQRLSAIDSFKKGPK
jgi:hypothetical protein